MDVDRGPWTENHRYVVQAFRPAATTMFTVHPDVLFREIDKECVLLDLGSGTYFGLNEVGTRIWSLLREGLAEDDIVRTIADEYAGDAATIRADVRRLLTELESRKLIVDGRGSLA